MKRPLSMLALLLASLVMTLTFAASSFALDRITLKNGKVVEGVITKEGDGFVFVDVMIGKMKRAEIITADQVSKIERDIDAKGAAAPSTAGTTATPTIPAGAEPAKPAEPEPATPPTSDDGVTKVCFISLEDEVGTYLNADALKKSVELVKNQNPDIVVLVINSGGGALLEVQPLSDYIHEEMKKHYRVVGWIQSAISAASMTVFNCEEIYMMREGNVGGTVAFSMQGGGAKAIDGEGLERVLKAGEEISKRGKRNPLIMRAMQVFGELSADIDENGKVTWYEGTQGKYLVNPDDRILTLNSDNAKKFGVSLGTADTKDELLRLMGVKEWKEVGLEADKYQREFRENVKKFSALANKLLSEFDLAKAAANSAANDEKLRLMYLGRAEGKLKELQSAVRKAPSFEKYSQFNKEWFEDQFDQLRKLKKPRT
ncbi:MAG: hypothetical protein JNK58_06720 [Phycisphaerae bacterium]|nr:hypothetical protein [Phycisphaerae bacterium]